MVVLAALQTPTSISVAKSHSLSPPSPLSPRDFQPHCIPCLTSAWLWSCPMGGNQEGKYWWVPKLPLLG